MSNNFFNRADILRHSIEKLKNGETVTSTLTVNSKEELIKLLNSDHLVPDKFPVKIYAESKQNMTYDKKITINRPNEIVILNYETVDFYADGLLHIDRTQIDFTADVVKKHINISMIIYITGKTGLHGINGMNGKSDSWSNLEERQGRNGLNGGDAEPCENSEFTFTKKMATYTYDEKGNFLPVKSTFLIRTFGGNGGDGGDGGNGGNGGFIHGYDHKGQRQNGGNGGNGGNGARHDRKYCIININSKYFNLIQKDEIDCTYGKKGGKGKGGASGACRVASVASGSILGNPGKDGKDGNPGKDGNAYHIYVFPY